MTEETLIARKKNERQIEKQKETRRDYLTNFQKKVIDFCQTGYYDSNTT